MRMKLKRKQVEQLEPFKNTAEFVSKLSAVTRGQAGRQGVEAVWRNTKDDIGGLVLTDCVSQ